MKLYTKRFPKKVNNLRVLLFWGTPKDFEWGPGVGRTYRRIMDTSSIAGRVVQAGPLLPSVHLSSPTGLDRHIHGTNTT